MNMQCMCCGKFFIYTSQYYIDNHRYKDKLSMFRCKNCDQIHSLLISGEINNEIELDLDKKIKITYNIHTETHDGYCSDPYNEGACDEEFTCIYPLIKGINNEVISNYMEVNSINAVNYYQKRFTECEKGSGYCGMYKIYDMKNIEIISI